MRSLWLCLFLLLAACAAREPVAVAPAAGERPPLILISIDGMRADYLDRGVTPVLAGLAARGVKARAMRPSFPSVTFPNHYTLVTGQRPDRNGIVANSMEDPAIPGVRFALSNREATTDRRWWDQAEPIWVTAENAGIATATMFWPGSEAAIGGVRPTYWAKYDTDLPNDQRVDGLLRWLDASRSGGKRPGFMTLYFEEVDHAGHEFGPEAPETTEAARHVDTAIGLLLDGLAARRIDANLIVVADHGMAATAATRVIRLDRVAPPASYRIVTAGTVAGLMPAPGQEAALASALLRRHQHMQCWRKGRIPARLHYGRNPRVPAFVCLAEVGWVILGPPPPDAPPPNFGGAHGYDPAAREMAAMFVAAGPGIRNGVTVPDFDNVDVYPLAMRLLGLVPLASDASEKLAGRARR